MTSNLEIDRLSSLFRSTTNSYKYYWFLSIISKIKSNSNFTIEVDDLVIEMIVLAWYPVNQFQLSFGVNDQFAIQIRAISDAFKGQVDSHLDVRGVLKQNKNHPVVTECN